MRPAHHLVASSTTSRSAALAPAARASTADPASTLAQRHGRRQVDVVDDDDRRLAHVDDAVGRLPPRGGRAGAAARRRPSRCATCQPRCPSGNVIGIRRRWLDHVERRQVDRLEVERHDVPAGFVWPGGSMRAPAGNDSNVFCVSRSSSLRSWNRARGNGAIAGAGGGREHATDAGRIDRDDGPGRHRPAVDVVEAQPERGHPLRHGQRAERMGQHVGGRHAGQRDERFAALGQLRAPARRVGEGGPHQRRGVDGRRRRQRPLVAPRVLEVDGLVPPQDGERRSTGGVPDLQLVAVEDDRRPRPTSACDRASGSARSRPSSTLKRPSS